MGAWGAHTKKSFEKSAYEAPLRQTPDTGTYPQALVLHWHITWFLVSSRLLLVAHPTATWPKLFGVVVVLLLALSDAETSQGVTVASWPCCGQHLQRRCLSL